MKTKYLFRVLLSLLAVSIIIFQSCKKDDPKVTTAPTAAFTVSPTSGTTNTIFTFDALGCTDNEDPTSVLKVRWDFDGDGNWDTDWETTKTIEHQHSIESTYNVLLEVQDTDGLTDQETQIIMVSNASSGVAPALIGYFQNWADPASPYIQLDQINSLYNYIDVSFAIPKSGTDYDMVFTPDQVTQAVFKTQIQALQVQGKKVIISMGGATAPISLDNDMERDIFISSMTTIVDTYGFDGIDIDFEGSSISLSGGTIANPVDQPIINLIYAIKQIMANYYTTNHKQLLLTMAPETAFVQGGQSGFSSIWGAYLPIIDALRDSIDILHVQLYNSGSMYGIDGKIYEPGTADFIIAMSEAVIHGFNTQGGMFNGLPASKVAVGLLACSDAADGFIVPDTVKAAINYLMGTGSKPGAYVLANANGYPELRGMMTWSINWDALPNCGGTYEFANNYESIFGTKKPSH